MRQQVSSLRRQQLMAERARANRNAQTPSEAALWNCLRGKQLGVEFKRQFVIGEKYIADFAAPSVRVIVEVDGDSHARRVTADARRDRWLQRQGWRVVRVSADEVLRQLSAALERVLAVLRA
jgi:very-short-patch-repair endonuclease